jgi:hypothetical protein
MGRDGGYDRPLNVPGRAGRREHVKMPEEGPSNGCSELLERLNSFTWRGRALRRAGLDGGGCLTMCALADRPFHVASVRKSSSTETHRDIAQRHTEDPNCEMLLKRAFAVGVLCVSLCDVSVCLCATALSGSWRNDLSDCDADHNASTRSSLWEPSTRD